MQGKSSSGVPPLRYSRCHARLLPTISRFAGLFRRQGCPAKARHPRPHLHENDPDHCQLGITLFGVLQACTCTVHVLRLHSSLLAPNFLGTPAVQLGRRARPQQVMKLDTQATARPFSLLPNTASRSD